MSDRRPTPARGARDRAAPGIIARRRIGVLMMLVVVAGGVALVAHRLDGPGNEAAASRSAVVHFSVGVQTCTFTDPTRETFNYATHVDDPGRVLVTVVRYPTTSPAPGLAETSGAAPARGHGPYPLVVFGHGYDLTPSDYASLLDAWVRAGFVVAAPLFPDTNANVVNALGKISAPEEDDVSQPGDVAFVTRQLEAAAASSGSGCPVVHGLLEANDVALAGQSDGASSADALAYASAFSAGPLPVKAVLSLSGQEMETSAGAAAGYAARPGDPALLVVQSRTDTCNPPEFSGTLYRAVVQRDRWFLALASGNHLPPYTDGPEAVNDFGVVVKVTTAFLRLELDGVVPHVASTPPGARASTALLSVGNASPGVATMTTGSAPVLPDLTQSDDACYET